MTAGDGASSTSIDDAIGYLVDWMRTPRAQQFSSSYGYEIYLPNVIAGYVREVERSSDHPSMQRDSPRAKQLSPLFYEAAWVLCRRGVLRPGLKEVGAQSVGEGDGYAVTSVGRSWLKGGASAVLLVDGSRLAQLFSALSEKFGTGFLQRAIEASTAHQFSCYLASCAMAGAAAESVLLAVAIAKTGDEEDILKTYHSAQGRRRILDLVVGRASPSIASQFRSGMGLLSYWRDEAAHGRASSISEIEAHHAITSLIRLAQFSNDNWADLTARA